MDNEIVTIENGIVSVPASAEIWMTQHEISSLFGCFVAKINVNIRAILKTGVLDEAKVCRTYQYKNGNSVEQCNLEMITALAFRIKSRNAEVFRVYLVRKAIMKISDVHVSLCQNWNDFSLN